MKNANDQVDWRVEEGKPCITFSMTREQEYLTRDMTDEDLEYCETEAKKLEQMLPWAEQDNSETDADSWLTVVMRVVAKEIEHHRGLYCAEMGD